MPISSAVVQRGGVLVVVDDRGRRREDPLDVSPRKLRVGLQHQGDDARHDRSGEGGSLPRIHAGVNAQTGRHEVADVLVPAGRSHHRERGSTGAVVGVHAVLPDGADRDGVPRVGPAVEVHVVELREGVSGGEGEDDSLSSATELDGRLHDVHGGRRELVVVAASADDDLGKVRAGVGIVLVVVLAVLRDGVLARGRQRSVDRHELSIANLAGLVIRVLVNEGTSPFVDDVALALRCSAQTGGHSDGVLGDIEGIQLVSQHGDGNVLGEEVARAEHGVRGDPRRAQVVVAVAQDDPRHFGTVALPVRGEVVRAGILRPSEPPLELQVVDEDAVVVDPDGHALPREAVLLPDVDGVDHVEHPGASVVGGILRLGLGGDARVGGVAVLGAQVIGRNRALLDAVGAVVLIGVVAGPVLGTVVATLGVEASVAVGLELIAVNVAIDAILVLAFVTARSSEVRIVADPITLGGTRGIGIGVPSREAGVVDLVFRLDGRW
mmetsp:Transcript_153/g.389  ORF Transcript_153/g.389 Transcript_153/m.389 type:complete len:494 (-) Transcript_153:521-2002(-)